MPVNDSTVDMFEIVRRRMADGRTISSPHVQGLLAEIERLRELVRRMRGEALSELARNDAELL
jgi:hypothetical protein